MYVSQHQLSYAKYCLCHITDLIGAHSIAHLIRKCCCFLTTIYTTEGTKIIIKFL